MRTHVVASILLILFIIPLTAFSISLLIPPTSQSVPVVRVSTLVSQFGALPIYLAEEKGLDNEQGIQFEIIRGRSAKATAEAVVTGDADFTATSTTTISLINSGAPLKVVGFLVHDNICSFFAREDIMNVSQLHGKKIGVDYIGGIYHVQTVPALRSFGIEPEEVSFVGLGGPRDVISALKAGEIDAGMASSPLSALVIGEGFRKLFDYNDVAPDWILGGVSTSERFIEEHPERVVKFLGAIRNAIEYIRDNREGTIDVIVSEYGVERSDAETIYDKYVDIYGIEIQRNAVESLLELYANQSGNEKKSVAEVIDDRFLIKVLEE